MQPCGRCFRRWQNRLESEPDAWIVRSVDDGLVWRNAAARNPRGVPAVASWRDAVNWAHVRDIPKIEDAYSLAIKTMTMQEVSFRFKDMTGRIGEVMSVIHPYRCDGCNRGCCVAITMTIPVFLRVAPHYSWPRA